MGRGASLLIPRLSFEIDTNKGAGMSLDQKILLTSCFRNAVEIQCLSSGINNNYIVSTIAQKVVSSARTQDYIEIACYKNEVKQFFVRLHNWRVV